MTDFSEDQMQEMLEVLEKKTKYNAIFYMYPEDGPLRRELYPKHMEFFTAGLTFNVVIFMAANRVGKTQGCTLYEMVLHCLGIYPSWWPGHKFDKPVRCVAMGHSADTIKDVLQRKLLGDDVNDFGTGLIPRRFIDFEGMTEATKSNTAITTIRVKHIPTGQWSTIRLKTYESGVKAHMGDEYDFAALDEEPPLPIYNEINTRLMTRNGKMRLSFTPLSGLTEMVTEICKADDGSTGDWTPGRKNDVVYLVSCTWWDVPHLTPAMIEQEITKTPEYLRDAKSKGIPQLNAGAVYPILEKDYVYDPGVLFGNGIPNNWKRVAAMDFGWIDPTAILWAAIEPETGTVYLYKEHYVSTKPPLFHAQEIKLHNKHLGYDVPIVCDPSGGGRGTHDGDRTRQIYLDEFDIRMESADNAIMSGISKSNQWLSDGRVKVSNRLVHFLAEIRLYRWNDKGQLVGENHLMDCFKYLIATGVELANNVDRHNESMDAWELARAQANEEDSNRGPESWYHGR